MDKAIIGTQIKNQRLHLGLTQTEFGNKIGITKQCLSGWEHGRAIPDVITLSKIAEFCGVSIDTFSSLNNDTPNIEQQNSNPAITEKELQLIHKLRTLSHGRRKAVEVLFGIRNKK